MFRRVCAFLLIVVVATHVVPAPEVEAHGGWWDATLRVWGYAGPVPQVKALQLSSEEEHGRYAFAVEIQEGQPPSAGYIEVRHSLSGDVVCRGPLSDVEGIHVYRYCDEIRVNHGYIVTYVITTPGDLHLYGVFPQA